MKQLFSPFNSIFMDFNYMFSLNFITYPTEMTPNTRVNWPMTKSPPREQPPIPAPKTRQAVHFLLAASKYVGRLVQDSLTHMVAPQNKLHLHHGRSWGDGRGGLGGSQGNLKLSSALTTITFDSVMRNDVVALRDFVKSVSEKMSADMTKHIYESRQLLIVSEKSCRWPRRVPLLMRFSKCCRTWSLE
jgi:hypothetical protein